MEKCTKYIRPGHSDQEGSVWQFFVHVRTQSFEMAKTPRLAAALSHPPPLLHSETVEEAVCVLGSPIKEGLLGTLLKKHRQAKILSSSQMLVHSDNSCKHSFTPGSEVTGAHHISNDCDSTH